MEKEIFLANLISEEGLQNTCRQIRPYHHHSRKKVLNQPADIVTTSANKNLLNIVWHTI